MFNSAVQSQYFLTWKVVKKKKLSSQKVKIAFFITFITTKKEE